MLGEVLEEGLARVIAGERGEPQDETLATYAGHFTDEECWLDWREPAATLLRRFVALNVVSPRARARIGGEAFQVLALRTVPGPATAPGTVLDRAGERLVVAAGDGAVEVRIRLLAAGTQTSRDRA